MDKNQWMIYGAYGYSGALIAHEAKRQGLKPILAGRNAEKTQALGRELDLPFRIFDLAEPDIGKNYLTEIALVLHCAGPFSQTAAPMLQACLSTGSHYLDITGEIEIFELAQQQHSQAQAAGIVVCPGVGFDVIPTDCLAHSLKTALPAATHLALGFDARSGFSRGTARTAVEGLAKGGCIRQDGRLTKVPLAYKQRRIDFGDGEKLAITIPWGDIATAYFSTAIPNIEVYIPASPRMAKKMRRMRLVQPFIKWGWVQNYLKKQVDKKIKGPNSKVRAKTPTHVWGEVRDQNGKTLVGRLQTANGYEVTKTGALAVVKHLLNQGPTPGYTTPSQLMGQDFASQLPGSTPIEIQTI